MTFQSDTLREEQGLSHREESLFEFSSIDMIITGQGQGADGHLKNDIVSLASP